MLMFDIRCADAADFHTLYAALIAACHYCR